MSAAERMGGPVSRLKKRYGPASIVTGASDGIGRAFAEHLAAEGFDLALVARRRDRLEELADALQRRHGITATVIVADLADPAAGAAIAEATATLDVGLLVAAAGYGSSGSFLDLPVGSEADMVTVNCRAVVDLSHRIGGRLAARRRGGIVLLSSVVAFQGVGTTATYAATKAFVQAFAEGLRLDLKPSGVDVIAAAPGPVRSGFATRAGMVMGATDTPAGVAASTLRALGRSGTVRPGPLSKILGWSLATAPRGLRVRILSAIMKGMSRRSGPAATSDAAASAAAAAGDG